MYNIYGPTLKIYTGICSQTEQGVFTIIILYNITLTEDLVLFTYGPKLTSDLHHFHMVQYGLSA